MRRSRSALVLFFCSFIGSLMGVGFADGGHQPVGKPADLYRLDLDETTDYWLGVCGPLPAEPASSAPLADVQPASPPGSEGWILIPLPGSPLGMILFVDDDTACALSCWESLEEPADRSETFAGCDAGPAAQESLADDRCTEADFVDWSRFTADSFGKLGCALDSEALGDFAANEEIRAVDAEIDNDLALREASAAGGLFPALLICQVLDAEALQREFVWDGCQTFPDASVQGWLSESAEMANVQAWRALGAVARDAIEELVARAERVLNTAAREIAHILRLPSAAQSSVQSTPPPREPESWPSVRRTTGEFLSL